MPFKSTKQKTYLAINKPDVYKKFKKEEKMMYGNKMSKRPMGGKVYKDTVKRNMGGKVTKRPMGGKVYKDTVKRPMGGKVYKVDNEGQMMIQRMYGGKVKNEY